MSDQQLFFNARDLWATQVSYYEHDKVEPITVTATRTMIFAGFWRTGSALALSGFEWPTDGELTGASELSADSAVVEA